jgi:hypothetical protein
MRKGDDALEGLGGRCLSADGWMAFEDEDEFEDEFDWS